ncbi:helix-turn-helix transcriptional regulator [Pseudarthrobacter sp. S9]|uniref:helix-turn-helix transcriptional regulator n=1 Tax=Pseudarthrobacter sp. S9 TaxID=3418421 RepID=UPI003CFCBC36
MTNNGVNIVTVDKAWEVTQSVYLDRRTTAQFMGVSEKFLATHLVDGPKRLRVGSKILYRLSDVEHWMRQQEVTR